MRVEIPDYFRVQTKILGLTKRQLVVVGATLVACLFIVKLPEPTVYVAAPLLGLPPSLAAAYLTIERLDHRATVMRLTLVLLAGVVAIAALFLSISLFLAPTGYQVRPDHLVRAWGLAFVAVPGIVFAFTDMLDWLKDYRRFKRAPRDAGWLDESVRALVPIERVEDDLLHLKDGGLRSVFAATPVSVHGLQEHSQRAIYRRYREWLDSLNGEERQIPVQIVMRMTDVGRKVDEYFELARKRVGRIAEEEDNQQLLQHFLALEKMTRRVMKDNRPRMPRFYLVVSHDDAYPRGRRGWLGLGGLFQDRGGERIGMLEDVDNTARIVAEKLREAGLRDIRRLTSEELVSLQRGFLTGLDVVAVDWLSLITRASLCTYCATDPDLCVRCVVQGGYENMFTEASEHG